MGHAQTTSPGRLRSALHKLTSSDRVLEAEDLREEAGRLGGTPVADLPDRQMACVCGTVRSVTLRPRAGVPALVAEALRRQRRAEGRLARPPPDPGHPGRRQAARARPRRPARRQVDRVQPLVRAC
nr:hypothetical protein [Angustibacter aerolatus]